MQHTGKPCHTQRGSRESCRQMIIHITVMVTIMMGWLSNTSINIGSNYQHSMITVIIYRPAVLQSECPRWCAGRYILPTEQLSVQSTPICLHVPQSCVLGLQSSPLSLVFLTPAPIFKPVYLHAIEVGNISQGARGEHKYHAIKQRKNTINQHNHKLSSTWALYRWSPRHG